MSTRIDSGFLALSEKEKQTLRLIVRGHDAKSIARSLDLSVHTINERLRDARRKLEVSSSREAARLLLAEEGEAAPQNVGDMGIGEALGGPAMDQGAAPGIGAGAASRRPWIIGVTLMSLLLGLFALTTLPHATAPAIPAATTIAPDSVVVDTARQWLALLDQSRWAESYTVAGAQFRAQNTVEMWTNASERVRVPLGAMRSRTFLSAEDIAAPPNGYVVVKFRTRFANKANAIEAVTLECEGDAWRVVGVTVE